MYLDVIMSNKKFKFNERDYLLYLLQHIKPSKSDKIKLNKVAFFVEFGYLHKTGHELSDASYAGINRGPVVDNYSDILEGMEKNELLQIENYRIIGLKEPGTEVPEEVSEIIDPLIEKYSNLSNGELIALSHATDSYLITTNNEKEMGNIIEKDLAALETFFEGDLRQEEIKEDNLPSIQKDNLVGYEFG